MKKILFVIVVYFLPFFGISQESYTINGEVIELKKEVAGSITLLWNIIDGKYRYFVKKDTEIKELINTKGGQNKYLEEYKTVLSSLTDNFKSTHKLNLTLPSLKKFIDSYNITQDSTYKSDDNTAKLESNLLIYGGLTNHPFNGNIENASNPIFGLEIEFYNKNKLPNHALFLGVNHALSSDEFDYSSTSFNFGYRYRIINTSSYSVYPSLTLASYSFSKEIIDYVENDTALEDEISGSSLKAPFSFGIGADFKLNSFSYITISYNELFALFLENQGNFSTHFNIGYKINL